MTEPYPERSPERDRWIIAQRLPRNVLDPLRPYAFLVEDERSDIGEVVPVATIFLTNRECPWRCLMCDLWKNTLTESVPSGAIPAQIDYALERLRRTGFQPVSESHREPGMNGLEARSTLPARQIKLYNSGSFFDPKAIPSDDYAAIAERGRGFERVVVESHPALVGDACLRFRDLLAAQPSSFFHSSNLPLRSCPLEVAMGLETAHPQVLEKLNKHMTLEQFSCAANFLREHDIALRVFILVKPPFLDEAEALHWAKRSIDFAFDCGATVASLIPTRLGNGALEALSYSPPKLSTLEAAAAYGIGLGKGRVFADLWDLEKFSDCPACFPARAARLREINLCQTVLPPVVCPRTLECGDLSPLFPGNSFGTRQSADKSAHSK